MRMKINEILEHLNRKEFVLPPFQRDFVWNNMEKIIKFVDSMYKGYPIGSIIIWKPSEEDLREEIKARSIAASVKGEPLYAKDYILDGQQRLTTICRVFQGDPFVFKNEEFVLHFNIENEEFLFIKKSEKAENVVPFHEIINKTNEQLVKKLKLENTEKIIKATSVFEKIRKIKDKEVVVEYSPPLKRESALELFIRLNVGGRPLETENLALGYISIKWPTVREEFEKFKAQISSTNFMFDFDFFVRCLSPISFGQSLKKKIVSRFGDKNVLSDWKKAKLGILRLIDLLKGELHLESDMFIEAQNTLIPLTLILSQQEVKGKERRLLTYAFLVSYINRRYSGVKFANLDADIELIRKGSNPIREWVKHLEKDKENLTYFRPQEIVENKDRTLELALFVLLKNMGVKQDLLGRNFLENAASDEDKPEFHHIFPRKTLEKTKFENDADHIANLTIITSKSNKEINKKQPQYLLDIDDDLKEQHLIPKDRKLYNIRKYPEFLKNRQELIAKALNNFLRSRSR